MDKKQIKKDLIAHLRGELRATGGGENVDENAAELDQNEPRAVDDISQSDETGEMRGLLSDVADTQRADIDAANALDESPADTVRPGAIVSFGGAHYLVGLATDAFTSGVVEYEGISPDAPIYAAMEGKKAGETFTFRDAKHTIDAVDCRAVFVQGRAGPAGAPLPMLEHTNDDAGRNRGVGR